MMNRLQDWIHMAEEGRGANILRWTAACLAFVMVAFVYDWRSAKNFSTPEAMDTAQVGRQLAQGKGYTTQFVRPLSVYLVSGADKKNDPRLTGEHPDLQNPPVYPALLAGLFKVAPVKWDIPAKTIFYIYQPERWITVLNQLFFFGAAVLLFRLARKLFDEPVAWVSTVLFVGAELFWRFSTSGLSTLWLVLLVLALVHVLVALDEAAQDPVPSGKKILKLAATAGLLLGLAALTRYSFAWLVLPVLGWFAFFPGPVRGRALPVLLGVFLLLLAPWITRNILVSGLPFGTATYALVENAGGIQGEALERSLDPSGKLDELTVQNLGRKIFLNVQGILQNDLPRLGGSWVAAFFLVGMLLPFRRALLSRARVFMLLTLLLFVLVQAGAQTHLTGDSRDINSENLLAVFAPLVFIFGAGFFFTLLEQVNLTVPGARQALVGLFAVMGCLPLLMAVTLDFMSGAVSPYAYPPYYPVMVQRIAEPVKKDALMMSDIPWAVAWYGQRQCSALTTDYNKAFFALHEGKKPVRALYLSPRVTDARLIYQVIYPAMTRQNVSWEDFAFRCINATQIMNGFPLRKLHRDFFPENVVLYE